METSKSNILGLLPLALVNLSSLILSTDLHILLSTQNILYFMYCHHFHYAHFLITLKITLFFFYHGDRMTPIVY